MARQGRSSGRRATYSRVSSTGEPINEDTEETSSQTTSNTSPLEEPLAPDADVSSLEQPPLLKDEDDADLISVVVLDPAHSRFQVPANPEWTVLQFKERGVAVHKVPAASQRLIFRGKMLSDDSTLKHFGITEEDMIVHLFPKPNVVVTGDDENEEGCDGGAHVPRIVLDPAEAERRSQILVLSSDEIFEAQHRVKLLCLLLLIICTMELLTLVSIMMGVDDDEQNDGPGEPTDSDDKPAMRTWQDSDYFDFVISVFGFYVAMLGIRATTENTLQLAKMYMYGTFAVGIAWNVYYYYINIQTERKAEAEGNSEHMDNFDLYVGALLALLLPIMVWILCCVRAYEFHELLVEAEREAEERTRSELELDEEQQMPEAEAIVVDHDQELALQIDENTRIT